MRGIRRIIAGCLVVVLLLSLCACKSSLTETESTIPRELDTPVTNTTPSEFTEPTEPSAPTESTEDPFQYIQIIAPVDIFEGNLPEDSNILLTVQEGYKLIQSVETDEYRYSRYYDIFSGAYGFIDIVPIVLEPIIKNGNLTYTAKTNFSGFYSRSPITYKGKTDESKYGFEWRGSNTGPEEVKAEERPEHIWVDIVIRANGNIVGIAVLEIVDWPGRGEDCYMLIDAYSECYHLVNGRFQPIDEDFVWQRIEQYHKFAES